MDMEGMVLVDGAKPMANLRTPVVIVLAVVAISALCTYLSLCTPSRSLPGYGFVKPVAPYGESSREWLANVEFVSKSNLSGIDAIYLLKVERLNIDRGFVSEVADRLGVRGLGLDGLECDESSTSIRCMKRVGDEMVDVLVDRRGPIALHIALYRPEIPITPGKVPAIVLPSNDHVKAHADRVIAEVLGLLSQRGFDVNSWRFEPKYIGTSGEYIIAVNGSVHRIPARIGVSYTAIYRGIPVEGLFNIEFSYNLTPRFVYLSLWNARPVKAFGRNQVISPEDALSRHMDRRVIDTIVSRAVREGTKAVARVELVYKAIETRKGDLYLVPLYAVEFDDLGRYYVPAIEDRDVLNVLTNAKTG